MLSRALITLRNRWVHPVFAFAIGCLISGCVSEPTQGTARAASDPDHLLVVDCLLPGQIRKLGQQATYLTPRRPIKTTAQDCEIRGGEYVAYDRASYATALKVWLPQAETGDPAAQTYVGEIYEKGLGIQADYALAARWYRKAADQGYSRAKINLGYLYEHGLGVEMDLVTAMNWYREASGLTDGELQFVSSVEIASRAAADKELGELRQEVEQRRTEEQLLAQQLEETQSALAQRKQELEAAVRDLESARNERQEGTHAAEFLHEDPPIAQREFQEREARLERERQAFARLQAETKDQQRQVEQALESKNRRQELLQAQLERHNRENDVLRGQLEATQAKLEKHQAQLHFGQKALEETRAELVQLRQVPASAENADAIEQLRKMLEDRQAMLDAQRKEMAWLESEVAEQRAQLTQELEIAKAQEQELRAELERRYRETAALQEHLTETQQQLGEVRQQLSAREAGMDAERRRFEDERLALEQQQQQQRATTAETDQALQTSEQRLAQREAEIAHQREEIAKLESDAKKYQAALAKLERALEESVVSTGPKIEIIDPPLALTRGVPSVKLRSLTKQLDVIGKITASAGLQAIRVNDREQNSDKNGLFRAQVPVRASETPVNVLAIDKRGRRTAVDFVLIREFGQAQPARQDATVPADTKIRSKVDFGSYHALIIGNNRYTHLPSLDSAVNDAKEVAKVLAERYGFKTTVVLNADRYAILSALNELREKITEKDNLLIYYAGHGELDRANVRGYWLPVNAEPESTANWISNIAITDILNAMSAKHVLVVADSCYAGAMTRSSLARLQTGMSDEKRIQWLKTIAKIRSRTVLTSGGVKPVLDAGGGEHSIFAKAFLDVLKENDQILEGYQLYREVAVRVRTAATALQVEQDPEYAPIKHAGHESGEFFLIPETLTGATASKLRLFAQARHPVLTLHSSVP